MNTLSDETIQGLQEMEALLGVGLRRSPNQGELWLRPEEKERLRALLHRRDVMGNLHFRPHLVGLAGQLLPEEIQAYLIGLMG